MKLREFPLFVRLDSSNTYLAREDTFSELTISSASTVYTRTPIPEEARPVSRYDILEPEPEPSQQPTVLRVLILLYFFVFLIEFLNPLTANV